MIPSEVNGVDGLHEVQSIVEGTEPFMTEEEAGGLEGQTRVETEAKSSGIGSP